MIQIADSEGPDQTARMRRLIWAFAVREVTFSHGAAHMWKKGLLLKAAWESWGMLEFSLLLMNFSSL